jgi:hypothetical protein
MPGMPACWLNSRGMEWSAAVRLWVAVDKIQGETLSSIGRVHYRVLNVKKSRNRPGLAQRVPGGLGSQIKWYSARGGGEVVSLTHRPPLAQGISLVLIFTRDWVDPRAMLRSQGNMSLKNPVTPPRIDPGTARLVAQRLNHYATPRAPL